jgi:DNA-directed RNA polymerase subunit E"
MAKEKACKQCKAIYSGVRCPKCNSTDASDSFKGKVVVLDVEQSDVAKNLGFKQKGEYAIKLG